MSKSQKIYFVLEGGGGVISSSTPPCSIPSYYVYVNMHKKLIVKLSVNETQGHLWKNVFFCIEKKSMNIVFLKAFLDLEIDRNYKTKDIFQTKKLFWHGTKSVSKFRANSTKFKIRICLCVCFQ